MIETLHADLDRPPGLARQGARAAPGHARGRRRPGHPVHDRHPRRHRRGPGRPRRGAGGHRRRPPPPRPRAGGDRPELPAQAGHGHAPRRAVPARRVPRGHRPRPPDPAARGPRPGPAQPLRRLRRAARRRHRRLGRRVAGDRRPREPRAAVARARPPARRSPRPGASPSRPASRSTPSSSLDARPLARRRPARSRSCDRTDAEGLGRDDPGRGVPRAHARRTPRPATAPRSCSSGAARPPWYSGADAAPPTLVPGPPARAVRRPVAEVLAGVRAGQEVGEDEIVDPVRRPGPEVAAVAEVADELRREAVGDIVTFVAQPQHQLHERVHVQVPVLRVLQGPAVAQPAGHALPADARRHRRAGRARRGTRGATEVCLQGGIHPDFDGDYYIDVARAVKDGGARHPRPRVHRARGHRGRPAPRRAARRLPAPAHGRRPAHRCPAPRPRSSTTRCGPILCPDKITTDEWLECPPHRPRGRACARTSRSCSARSSARGRGPATWCAPATCRRETGGFTEFVPLPFVHMAAPIYLQHKARRGPTFREVAAHARRGPHRLPGLDRQHPGLVGEDRRSAARASCCRPACNDLGGTLMDENISRAAGASHGQEMTPEGFADMVEPLGRTLAAAHDALRSGRGVGDPRLTTAPDLRDRMSYHLGVDVGTTYTAAAVGRRRRAAVGAAAGRRPRHPQRVRALGGVPGRRPVRSWASPPPGGR